MTNHSSTILDLIFTNSFEDCLDCGVIEENLSDHYITYNSVKVDNTTKNEKYFCRRAVEKVDVKNFEAHFLDKMNNGKRCKFDAMNDIFLSTLDTFCPFVSKVSKKPYASWMKSNDITLLQRKRDAAKIYLRKNPTDKFKLPSSLKSSTLLPLPKDKTSLRDLKDYRPIAIQPTFSKIFEKNLTHTN